MLSLFSPLMKLRIILGTLEAEVFLQEEKSACVTQRQDVRIFFGNKLTFLELGSNTDCLFKIKSGREDFTVTNYTCWLLTIFFASFKNSL